jgi:hypothetical protein
VSPEELLVPIFAGSIAVAVVLFALVFFRHDATVEPLPPAQVPDPSDPPEEEGDGWYFVRHQPCERPADLSPP